MTGARKFIACFSDERTDIPTSPFRPSSRVWGYEVQAPDPIRAAYLGVDLWHTEVALRTGCKFSHPSAPLSSPRMRVLRRRG